MASHSGLPAESTPDYVWAATPYDSTRREGFAERRLWRAACAVRSPAGSCFGTGSGSQALTGIPIVRRLPTIGTGRPCQGLAIRDGVATGRGM